MILKTNIVVKDVETRFEVKDHLSVEDSGFTANGLQCCHLFYSILIFVSIVAASWLRTTTIYISVHE